MIACGIGANRLFTIKVEVTPQLVIQPEHGGDGAWVSQTCRLQEDVVKGSPLLHEIFNGLHTCISVKRENDNILVHVSKAATCSHTEY